MNLKPLSESKQNHAKILIHGGPGSGTTALATTIAELGPTLYIYLQGEEGLGSIASNVRENIYPVNPKSVEDVQKLLWFLLGKRHQFVAVVIEGLTHWQRLYSHYVQAFEENKPIPLAKGEARDRLRMVDQRRIGGKVGQYLASEIPVWYTLANASRAKPIHVVMTAQSRFRQVWSKVEGDDEEERGELVREYIGPDIYPNLVSHAEASPDHILYTEKLEDELGDNVNFVVRTGAHPLIITKTREAVDTPPDKRWPAVVGTDGERMTLVPYLQHMNIPTGA